MIMAQSAHPLPLPRAFVLKVRAKKPMYEWKITILPGGSEEVGILTCVKEVFLE